MASLTRLLSKLQLEYGNGGASSKNSKEVTEAKGGKVGKGW